MDKTIDTEVLIIGSGIAGCVAALRAAEFASQVTVLTKEKNPEESNSYYAQGGIIYKGENDSPGQLVQDILYAGAAINKKKAAEILANEGPALVEKVLMEQVGIPFSTDNDGILDLTEEGGHNARRIIHYQDHTGKKIQLSLLDVIEAHPKIQVLSNFTAMDLISSTHHSSNPLDIYEPIEILGVYALNEKKVWKIRSKVTVLASGGLGNVYLHSSNPDGATGDGVAMAYRAGARVINMEYTQFHPTTLFHKDSKRFLISESVRGEGAILLNKEGEAFMDKYHPMKDLAPRDVVSRSILTEMTEKKKNYVYLDIARIGSPDKIKNRFPHIYENCLKYNIDITKDMVPVVPAYHFSCGGVYTDLWGKTNLKRLFAIGEVSCTGVHGGNRLASTSLLEGLTFGHRAMSHVEENWNNYNKIKSFDIPDWKITGLEQQDKSLINQDWSSIKNIMWNYVGPIRSAKRLSRALKDLYHLSDAIESFYRDCFPDKDLIELRNGVQTAQVVTLSAWKNKKSIGAHYREE